MDDKLRKSLWDLGYTVTAPDSGHPGVKITLIQRDGKPVALTTRIQGDVPISEICSKLVLSSTLRPALMAGGLLSADGSTTTGQLVFAEVIEESKERLFAEDEEGRSLLQRGAEWVCEQLGVDISSSPSV